ncbi:MAG: hypothetical protein HOK81_01985 [Rhodospirillaceae bacterium]|jgi:hypothetical protein|nr:hypothetical protein [Rhodospirillaceae bacterium]
MSDSVSERTRSTTTTTEPYGAKLRRELEDDYRVFYVTAWGYAADHYFGWFPKALNLHPEIFALLAHEGSRPKYLKERTRAQRPPLMPFTEFLNDMGMTYQAIGDCYSYRAGQMPELLQNPRYKDIPVVNLVRHPFVWLEFYIRWRAGNMRMRAGGADPLAWEWKVTHHGYFRHLGLEPYAKEEVEVWAAFQGMVQLNNVLGDLPAVERHVPVERVATDRDAFTGLVSYLTKGRCAYEPGDLDRVFTMADTLFRGEEPVDTNPKALVESWPGWKADAFRRLLSRDALDAYKSFGYDLFGLDAAPAKPAAKAAGGPARPIFVASMMKSGTWLLREILRQLTGLAYREPGIGLGTPAYDDEMLIDIPPGTFFSWHSTLNERSTALLKGAATKNILLVRNIYDVVVSMYNHIAKDADAAIGRSVLGSDYLSDIPPETALSMMIAGFTTPRLSWDGIAPHVRQVASFLRFMEEGGDALLLTHEELTRNKPEAIRRIARYLEMPIGDDRIAEIVETTGFEAMESVAKETGTEKHFTSKRDRDIKKFVQPYHVAMVDHVVMQEIPDVSERLARAGVPWLFDRDGAPPNLTPPKDGSR